MENNESSQASNEEEQQEEAEEVDQENGSGDDDDEDDGGGDDDENDGGGDDDDDHGGDDDDEDDGGGDDDDNHGGDDDDDEDNGGGEDDDHDHGGDNEDYDGDDDDGGDDDDDTGDDDDDGCGDDEDDDDDGGDDNDDDDDDNDDNGDDDDDDHDDDDDGDGGDDEDNDDDTEMNDIHLLLGKEVTNPGLNDEQAALITNDAWIRVARTRAVLWILKRGRELRFAVRRIYTSVIYLNRFLASRRIQGGTLWTVRLLGSACLSLSAQMDGKNRRHVRDTNITHVNHILRMESIVLNEFNWNIDFVTPFPFATFILSRFTTQVSEATRKRIVLFILMVLKDARLMTHRPSVIAAAAILLAVDNDFNQEELEIEIIDFPLYEFLNTGNVWYCYNRLRELNIRNI